MPRRRRRVTIDLVSIADSQVGINASAANPLTLGITNCDMQGVTFGVQVQYNVDATIDSNEIAAATYGLVVLAQPSSSVAPDVTATNNTITGALIGMSAAAPFNQGSTGTPTLEATGNTIVGPGPVANTTHGLAYNLQAAGSADDNEISNFFDSRANVGCGIFVAADAGVVTIGATTPNTFPPPAASRKLRHLRQRREPGVVRPHQRSMNHAGAPIARR